MRAAHLKNSVRNAKPGVRALTFHVVKQRPGRTRGAGVHTHARTNPFEDFTSRAEHCLGDFLPALSEISGGQAPVVPRPACAFGAGALKALSIEFDHKVELRLATMIRDGP